MGTSHSTAMVFSFTEQASQGDGMLCYQTAMKGEPTLKSMMDEHKGPWAPNTGVLVDKPCKERDDSYGSAMPANAVLRAEGLPWKATPGNPTFSISQWWKKN